MYKEPLWYIRCVVLVFGIMLLALGITFTIQGGLGVNPWTVFHVGISSLTGLTVGRVTQLVGLVLLAIGAVMLRQLPGVGTVVNMYLVGWFVDVFMGLPWPELNHWSYQLFYVALGISLIGIGTGTYISTDFGAGPRDAIMLGLSRLWKKPVGRIRSGMEFGVLVVGFLLGGPVGLGTLFSVLVGPVVQWSLRGMNRYWEVHWHVQRRHV